MGPQRTRFLLGACRALDADFQLFGQRLHFGAGNTADEIGQLVDRCRALLPDCSRVALHHYHDSLAESTVREEAVADEFRRRAAAAGLHAEVRSFWGLTLHHPHDLPWREFVRAASARDELQTAASSQGETAARGDEERPSCGEQGGASLLSGSATPPEPRLDLDAKAFADLPDVMTTFMKAVQAHSEVRPSVPKPDTIPPPPPGLIVGRIPDSLEDCYRRFDGAAAALVRLQEMTAEHASVTSVEAADVQAAQHSAVPFQAGEGTGMARLRSYIWGHVDGDGTQQSTAPLLRYKETRMLAVGVDNSAKLSLHLAHGCISPRMVYEELQRFAARSAADSNHAGAQEGCDWLLMHLRIRDFFTFAAMKAGDRLFDAGGTAVPAGAVQWSRDEALFLQWAQGRTGFPFVDACMRELSSTGYMSNRGRQNTASFLTKTLGVDWRWGAQLFECLLTDCDMAVNYSNWHYFAGIGNDPRNRAFKVVSQGMTYDPEAKLIESWIPELAALPAHLRHQPWTATADERASLSFVPGQTYPHPIVDPASQIKAAVRANRRPKAASKKA